jgi:hypothetical protein
MHDVHVVLLYVVLAINFGVRVPVLSTSRRRSRRPFQRFSALLWVLGSTPSGL